MSYVAGWSWYKLFSFFVYNYIVNGVLSERVFMTILITTL